MINFNIESFIALIAHLNRMWIAAILAGFDIVPDQKNLNGAIRSPTETMAAISVFYVHFIPPGSCGS
jgi:hypothetical protein